MRTRRPTTLVAFALVCSSASASAGVLDSPPPTLSAAEPARVIYRLAPVYYDPGWVDTIVTCANLSDGPLEIALEVFDEQDQIQGGVTRATAAAGGSVTFQTSFAAEREGATDIAGLPAITHGKARISAASSKISCSALHRFRADDDVSFKEAPLGMVKKVAFGDP